MPFLAATVALLSLAFSGHGGWSQTARTIRIIVPFPPGGPTDFLARVLAEQVGRTRGVTIVAENRPGAGSTVGTEAAARAAPDGNTLVVNSKETVINPHVRRVGYDPMRSFEPICQLVKSPTVISVNSASPYRTINDLFDAARTRRNELTLAASGPASPFQIGFEMLRHAANIDMTFVPYPGGAPVVNALLGNHVTSAFTTFLTVAEQIKAGKVRALAVPSRRRTRELPEVPTLSEAGYGDLEVDIWYGLAAPARTAQRTLAELSTWFAAAMQSPEVTAKLMVQGLNPAVVCGAEFEALIQKQYDEYGRVIRESNIKAE